MIGDAVAGAAEKFTDSISNQLEAAGLQIALIGLAGVLLVLAVVAATVSIGFYLATMFGAPGAALIVSGIYVGLAVLSFFIARHEVSMEAYSVEIEPTEVIEDEAEETMDTLGIPQFLLVAAGVGAMVGVRVLGCDDREDGSGSNQESSFAHIASSMLSVLSIARSLQEMHDASDSGVEASGHAAGP